MLLPLMATGSSRLQAGEIRLTLLDVGQGLAAVVQTGQHWLVYDTGAKFAEDSDMGQNVLLPFLRTQGAVRIDRLVVSHGDNDHIGGAESLIDGVAVQTVMTSAPEQLRAHAPIGCTAGQTWEWDNVRFSVLSPLRIGPGSDNNHSCVLKIESEHGSNRSSVLSRGDVNIHRNIKVP